MIQKWGPLAFQWGIYTGIVGGTSGMLALAGQHGILGVSANGGLVAAEAFPVIVVGSTLFNLALNTALGGGERLCRSMGGQVSVDQGLNNMVFEVFSGAGLTSAAPKVFIIPSREPNAFTAGTGDHRVVGVTTGLLDFLEPIEVKAVVAHEVGHIKNNDVSRSLQTASMLAGLSSAWIFGDNILRASRYRQSYNSSSRGETSSSGALAAAVGLSLYVAGLLTYMSGTLLRLASSRSAEFAADAASAKAMGSGKPLAAALLKLESTHSRPRDALAASRCSYAHMYIDNPPSRQPLESAWGLLRTHPPTGERVKRLLEIDGELPK